MSTINCQSAVADSWLNPGFLFLFPFVPYLIKEIKVRFSLGWYLFFLNASLTSIPIGLEAWS